jgi:hypothetical protein
MIKIKELELHHGITKIFLQQEVKIIVYLFMI